MLFSAIYVTAWFSELRQVEQHGPIETLIYVQVPDLQKALDAAEQLGGKTVVPPTSTVGSRRIAQFEDPEGNIIGLVQG